MQTGGGVAATTAAGAPHAPAQGWSSAAPQASAAGASRYRARQAAARLQVGVAARATACPLRTSLRCILSDAPTQLRHATEPQQRADSADQQDQDTRSGK